MTENLGILKKLQPYYGFDTVKVGNGYNFFITHIDSTYIPTEYGNVDINKPAMSQKILIELEIL